jgi:hypothetical protein
MNDDFLSGIQQWFTQGDRAELRVAAGVVSYRNPIDLRVFSQFARKIAGLNGFGFIQSAASRDEFHTAGEAASALENLLKIRHGIIAGIKV